MSILFDSILDSTIAKHCSFRSCFNSGIYAFRTAELSSFHWNHFPRRTRHLSFKESSRRESSYGRLMEYELRMHCAVDIARGISKLISLTFKYSSSKTDCTICLTPEDDSELDYLVKFGETLEVANCTMFAQVAQQVWCFLPFQVLSHSL